MTYQIVGAVLIVSGCGGFGISLAAAEKSREKIFRQLLSALQFMELELQYHLTPLPELLILAGKHSGGQIAAIFRGVSQELKEQVLPDVSSCMQKVLQQKETDRPVRMILRQLGLGLGCFDLPGQLKGLQEAEESCLRELTKLEEGKSQRFRNYETLGFCAGIALAILFF